MRTLARISLFVLCVLGASLSSFGAAFTPGNVVVYRVGDGAGALGSGATAVFLDEYTPAGSLVQSIAMPTADSAPNQILTASGTSTTEGQMSRSANGNYIVLTGYDAAVGTAGITTSSSATIARVVGRVDAAGNVDTSTALNTFSGGNPRGAASSNGIDIWLTGSNTGVVYTTFGTTAATTVSTTATNLRGAAVAGGQLYISSGAGTIRIGAVGTGTPTAAGAITTSIPGFPTAGVSVNEFALLDLDAGVAGVDTLYLCDDTSATAGLHKYSLVSGNWALNGTIATGCRGLAASVAGSSVTLYFTTTTATNLRTVTDNSGYNGAFAGSPTTIVTAGANTALRGVALAPVAATPDLTVSVSGPANAVVGVNYNYTLTVTNGGLAATGVAVNFTLPSGVSFVSASASGFSSSEAGGVVSFTGGSVAGSNGQAVLAVTVTPTSPGGVTVPAGAGVADPGNTIVESNEGNNATTQVVNTTVANADPDLTASISGPANAAVSTNYDYLITIQNIGNSTASAVAVNFALPSGVTYVGSTTPGGFSATLNGSTVEFTGGTVNVGSPVVFTVTVTAPAAPTGVTVSPGAVVADPLNAIVELSEGNNASTETLNTVVTAALQPDLTVSISGPPTGTTYTNYDYTITAANGGSASASTVRVDFALPPGVSYVGATVAGGFTASPSGGTVQFTGGTIAAAGNVVLTVTVKAPGAPTTVNVAAGAVVADPLNTIAEGDEGNNATTATVATVVTDPANLKKVHEVQGNTLTSPIAGQTVTVDAIVTGHYPGLSGFFVQETDANADADPVTSEGIFVFNGTTVGVGDRVRVAGTVTEFLSTGITVTELTAVTSVITISTGNPLPTAATVTLPVASIDDLERYEGMRVAFTQTLTVTNTFDLARFGEATLSVGGVLIQPTNVIDPNDNPASGTTSTGNSNVAAVLAAQDLNLRKSIKIEDGSTSQNASTIQFWDTAQNTLRLGSTADNLGGIMHHAFGSYRVLPQAATWTYAQRPLAPPSVGTTNVKVAGMNTLNYFNGNGSGGGFPTSRGADSALEFTRQRDKTIQAIHQLGADIVGLMEMENDGTGGTSAIQDLVTGLNDVAGAGTWAFINDPAGYTGLPGGTDEIKPALIYKPAVVTPFGVSLASGDSAFSNGRAPVAQTFTLANGQKVTVVANHFKSKGSGGSGLDADQNDGQGFFNNSRKLQATALLNFVNTTVIPAAGDPKVILLGDFNAYEQEDPMDLMRAGGYQPLAEGITSYSFGGQSGALDHVLVSAALAPKVTGANKWHINADEPTIVDYNVEFKNTTGCSSSCTSPDHYAATPFRSADHDPVLVGLFLAVAPGAPQNLQGTAGNAQIVLTYQAPASDGGSPITGYNASCTDGGSNTGNGSSVGAALTITVGALVNGVAYSCTVTATNAIGAGPASTAATNLTPSTVPGAPTNVQGTAGDATATLTYLAPASNGGSPITGYAASCTGGSGAAGSSVGTALTITLNGLTNGVTYTCTVVAINANGSSVTSAPAQVSPLQPSYALTVSKTGAGSGGVTSSPAGIDCGATCGGTFANGATVTLTAAPAAGSTFAGWSGACSGTGACVVTMGGDRAVTATFAVANHTLTVSKLGSGTGTVISTAPASPPINCGATCSADYAHGTVVTLSATATAGSGFLAWTGACSGRAACTVTMDAAKSVTATFVNPRRLVNISTRMQVLTGDNVLIGGFIVGGSEPKTLVVRARGPSLVQHGITNALVNPKLDLYSGQTVIASNDDHGTAANAADLQASGFAPAEAAESAILVTLAPGAYTAIVSGVGGTTGVGLIEIFEVDRFEVPLINISTRGQVLTGNDVMIGGFIIQGNEPQTVVVRARGPSLAAHGIASPLANPTMELFAGQTIIATNDDWGSAANAQAITDSGFAPLDPRESAILMTLNPGAYSVVVRGVGGTTGIGIVEVFAN